MKVIIPVAGIGSRLQPHTLTQPKPLLKVGNRPIIDYLLKPLEKISPEEVIFVIGYKGAMIQEYVEKTYAFKSSFVWQDKLLGLGYAIHMAMEKVNRSPVLILLGDTIVECDLAAFVKAGDYALGLRQVEDPHRFGIAEINNGHIVSLEEKPKNPKTNLAVIGLYYFNESEALRKELKELVASGKRTSGEIQLTDALAAMLHSGIRFAPYEVQSWYDCGKKETMLETNKHFLKKLPAPSSIPGSVLIPPVAIGENVTIVNSVIGPDVSIAENSQIHHSIISNAIIGKQSVIKDSVLTDSIIGSNTMVSGKKGVLNIGDSTEVDGV